MDEAEVEVDLSPAVTPLVRARAVDQLQALALTPAPASDQVQL